MPVSIEDASREEESRRVKWEKNTVAIIDAGIRYTVADLRTLFDGVCDKSDWKRPIVAFVTRANVSKTVVAIQWFHGGFVRVSCDPMLADTFRLENEGYQG